MFLRESISEQLGQSTPKEDSNALYVLKQGCAIPLNKRYIEFIKKAYLDLVNIFTESANFADSV